LIYIDIHTHTYYQDPETTLVLNVFPEEREKLELPCYFSIGLHPWHVQVKTWEKQVEFIRTVAGNSNVLAIGETGLDKSVHTAYATQQQAFLAQLTIAEYLGKSLIIHCVRSYSEMLAFRKKSDQSVPWIFHWFNSDQQIARELIRKNCYLSFGHMLFNEQSKAFKAFQSIPIDQVFFETDDAGYTIREVYEKAAEIRNLTVTDLKTQILINFRNCFHNLSYGTLVKPD
jgi:TatD DNase family protein